MSHPTWTSLPPPTLSHPSRSLQSPSVNSFSEQIAIGYLFSVGICFHATLSNHLILSFLPAALVHKSVLYVSVGVTNLMRIWEVSVA